MTEPAVQTPARASDPPGAPDAPPDPRRQWALAVVLFVATFASTTWVGAGMVPGMTFLPVPWLGLSLPADPLAGLAFAAPLLAILLSHELGHFVAARIHGVPVSPPYFIPMPLTLLGTMGAVIRMRGRIASRDALLDIGAAGPLAGFAVAVPVLIYGIATSPVEPLPAETGYVIEGRSVFYLAVLHALHGAIPDGHDVFLSPTAFAGWAGLLVTMINLLPIGQLDGGHVAYALLGTRQDRWSERWRRVLPLLALVVSGLYEAEAWLRADERALENDWSAGVPWLVWAGVLWVLTRLGGAEHPPTEPAPLSRGRRVVAIVTLALFVLLFMPAWIRQR